MAKQRRNKRRGVVSQGPAGQAFNYTQSRSGGFVPNIANAQSLASQAGMSAWGSAPNAGGNFYGQAGPGQGAGAPILGPMPQYEGLSPAELDNLEYGAPGIPILAGVIQDVEYNPDLQWRQYVRIVEKMRRSEPIVNQTMLIGDLPILSAIYKIAPASARPEHLEHASFIESSLFHDLEGQTWSELLRQILLMRPFGFNIFEKVFTQEDADGEGMPTTRWKYFAPRHPRTLYRWWEGANNNLAGIQQWTWSITDQRYEFINIDAGKLLRFTYRQEANNYEGLPLLRSSYTPWYYKQALLKIMMVGYEREWVGIPVVHLPAGYSSGDMNRARQIGKNMRSNEFGYVTLPDGWEVEWLKVKTATSKGGGIVEALRYLDLLMQANVLAQFVSLGQSGTGSYAMSTDQTELCMRLSQADANYICDVFSSDAFPELVRFNYGEAGMYPTMVVQNLNAYNVETMAKAISALVTAGAMRPTIELEDYMYHHLGIPRPPVNFVEATDPKDGYSRGLLQPDATGLTPLPLTPQEEIAIAYRQTRDLQKIGVQEPGSSGNSTDANKVVVSQDAYKQADALAKQNERRGFVPRLDRGKAAAGEGSQSGSLSELSEMNEIYLDARRLGRMRPTQREAYARMARDAGRPVIRLRGDFLFEPPVRESGVLNLADNESGPQEDRDARRQAMGADLAQGMRENFTKLRQDLVDYLGQEPVA